MSGTLTQEAKDFYQLDYYGRPPMFVEAYAGKNAELREYLATLTPEQKTALFNIRIRSQGGQTLAHLPCFGSASLETVQILRENGADFTIEDESGRLPFDIAANAGKLDIIQYLFTPERLEHRDKFRRSPLHALSMPGSSAGEKATRDELFASLQFLLSSYANNKDKIRKLTEYDIFEVTPLMYANHFKNADPRFDAILRFAQSIGVDLETISKIPLYNPALHRDYWGRNAVMEYVFAQDYVDTPDRQNVDRNQDKLRWELELPSDRNDPTSVNHQFGKRNTLHYAVNGTAAKVAIVLADHGRKRANPTAGDEFGSTALHFAAFRGNEEVLNVLLGNAAIKDNINKVDNFGMNALHALAMNASLKAISARTLCIELLVKSGADVFAKNKFGHTPAEVARIRGNTAIATYLAQIEQAPQPKPSVLWSFGSQANTAPADVPERLETTGQAATTTSNQAPRP